MSSEKKTQRRMKQDVCDLLEEISWCASGIYVPLTPDLRR